MYTVDDPWGEEALHANAGPPLWVHATMCWLAALLFGLYFVLDWLIVGFDAWSIFWGLFSGYYLWRGVVYTKRHSLGVD